MFGNELKVLVSDFRSELDNVKVFVELREVCLRNGDKLAEHRGNSWSWRLSIVAVRLDSETAVIFPTFQVFRESFISM